MFFLEAKPDCSVKLFLYFVGSLSCQFRHLVSSGLLQLVGLTDSCCKFRTHSHKVVNVVYRELLQESSGAMVQLLRSSSLPQLVFSVSHPKAPISTLKTVFSISWRCFSSSYTGVVT